MKLVFLLTTMILFCQESFSLKITSLADLKGNELAVTEIDFSNKGLTKVPAEITTCKNLISLNLSQNGLFQLPTELAELKMLKSLNLSNNQSLNPIDLNTFLSNAKFQLTELNLNNCNLLVLPESIVNQKSLKKLFVKENRIATLPSNMMNLNKLQDVDLSFNKLVDVSWILNYWWSIKNIDFSMNVELQSSEALASLSYYDQIEKIVISHLSELPKNFEILNVNELIIQQSVITNWTRSSLSNQIKALTFDNCIFEGLPRIVENINQYKAPNKVKLMNMDAVDITNFLSLEVDSIQLDNISSINLTPLINCKKLKFLDVRSCQITRSDYENFKDKRPDVELLHKEGIPNNNGINPPIQKFIPQAQLQIINPTQENVAKIGSSIFTIPVGSIVDKNGNPVNEPVTLSYTEYTNPADIFLSGINMTLEEDGETMMFSSGGMFNLSATDKSGDEVFVNSENPIGVQMFSQSENPDMKLYQLDKSGVWKLEGENGLVKPFEYDQAKIDSILNFDFEDAYYQQIQIITDRYVPVFKKDKKYKTFKMNMRYYPKFTQPKRRESLKNYRYYERDYIAQFLTKYSLIFEGDSVDFYFNYLDSISEVSQERYEYLRIPKTRLYQTIGPNYFYDYKIKPNYENDNFDLSFNYKDSLITLPFNLAPYGNSSDMVKSTSGFFRKYTRSWMSNKKLRTKTDLLIKNRLAIGMEELKKKAVKEEKTRQEMLAINADFMNEAAGIGSITRAFTVNGFGTWNCDVRSRMINPTPLNTDFVAGANEKMSAHDNKVAVIDRDLNSTIQFESGSDVFYDRANRNVIIIFFSTALVGVYKTIHDSFDGKPQQLQLIDISTMNKETFANIILNEF